MSTQTPADYLDTDPDDREHHDDDAEWKRLQEGARYRQTARDNAPRDPSIDTECQGCQGHVTKRFVRVFGVDGQVSVCPECSTNREITGGLFADGGQS